MPSCDFDVGDIEDAVRKDDLTPNDRVTSRKSVLPKARSTKLKRNGAREQPVGDSIIPGTQSIFVRTWGCSHNNSDSEYMSGQLAAFGYQITGKENTLLFVNVYPQGDYTIKLLDVTIKLYTNRVKTLVSA